MADELTPVERTLIESALSLAVGLDTAKTCAALLDALERVFGARSSWVMLIDPDRGELATVVARGDGIETYGNARIPIRDRNLVGLAFEEGHPFVVPDVREETRWFDTARIHASGLQSVVLVPILYQREAVGVFGFESPRFTKDSPPSTSDLNRLQALAAQTAVAVGNARLVESIEQDRRRLRRLLQERRQLRGEIGHLREAVREAHAFTSALGESPQWREVLEQADLVAPADSTVLLIGETGTGKELVARAVHERSRRRRQPFVAINCAAFPESLVESELFGHERGAFTGALERKPGKFELADRGTLFLDEIGELPAPAQAKLLRVLQEREVTRVGGTRPFPVNVRLIAATNRNLQDALRDGSLRQDLFYRLSVFPISLPPLRDRPEDIHLLAKDFVRRVAERQGRESPALTETAMRELEAYPWPGNVRELQNVLERAVILARGGEIGPELLHLEPHGMMTPAPAAIAGEGALTSASSPPPVPEAPAPRSGDGVVSFSEAERRAILQALERSGWRISGRNGAADLLGLKPTTLHAKMKRLRLRRPSVKEPEPPPPSDPVPPPIGPTN